MNKPSVVRKKPELIDIGKRQMTSSGRWNDELLAQYVRNNGRMKWLQIGDLARVAYGQNMQGTRKNVRRRLPGLFRYLLKEYAILLSVDYDAKGHHEAMAVKVYDKASVAETELLKARMEKMINRRELSASMLQTMQILLFDNENPPAVA